MRFPRWKTRRNSAGGGLQATFALLSTIENEAAVPTLLAAIDARHEAIGDAALIAVLARRDSVGHGEVIRRLDRLNERRQAIVREHGRSMTHALRDVVLSTERQTCENACDLIRWFGEYDLIPTLLTALGDPSNPNKGLFSVTLLDLVEGLYETLAGVRAERLQRDPVTMRSHILGALEKSVVRYPQHQRREVVEAFLLLVNRDNAILKQILSNPRHALFFVVIDILSKSPREGVIQLLLRCLDDPHAASAVLSIIGHRCDTPFIAFLLKKIGHEPSEIAAKNLKRIEKIGWLDHATRLIDSLDDGQQHAVVQYVVGSGISRSQAQRVVEYALLRGKPGGRRAAANALAKFHGTRANTLALHALRDEDPVVQANVARQLRGRSIPGVIARLVALADSPHAVVRQAVLESLGEFTFEQYLTRFDVLDEESRQNMGLLVKRIDPNTLPQLRKALRSKIRTYRLRALRIVRTIKVTDQLESLIVAALDDEDHLIRLEAVLALAESHSPTAGKGLTQATRDRSVSVAQAALEGLAKWKRSTHAQPQLLPSGEPRP